MVLQLTRAICLRTRRTTPKTSSPGLDLLDNFLPILRTAIAKHKGLKLHVSALWLGSNFGQVESFWATTPLRHTLSPQEVFPTLQELKDALQNVITQQELTGSG